MKFGGDEYYRASIERMRQARLLLNAGSSFSLAMYSGGLAVECMLRAFRWRKDATFEGRHDLEDLLKASELLIINEVHMRKRGISEAEILGYSLALRASMNEVMVLWHNNLRFASEASLKAFLRRIDRLRGIKGDPLKKNASDLLNAAQMVVDRGVAIWTSKTR